MKQQVVIKPLNSPESAVHAQWGIQRLLDDGWYVDKTEHTHDYLVVFLIKGENENEQ